MTDAGQARVRISKCRLGNPGTCCAFFLAWLLYLPLLGAWVEARADIDGYRIAPGDSISVSVFGESDLSLRNVRVGSNGAISYPLLGTVYVKGLTAEGVEKQLTRLLADGYLKKPQVTVSISGYRQFYVHGEVKRPGGYSYQDGLTVQKAITLAGGFTERASRKKITMKRETDPGNPMHSVRMNDSVHPGDIITVGESFF